MAEFLLTKSDLSENAAEKLNKEHLYCILWNNDLKMQYDDYKKKILKSNHLYDGNQRVVGIHEFLINECFKHIFNLIDYKISRVFRMI